MVLQQTPRSSMNRSAFLKLAACGAICLSMPGGLVRPTPSHGYGQILDAPPPNALRGFVNPRPAAWFDRLENNAVRCSLCPHQCTLTPGQRSVCRVRENRDGQGYTLAYANPALIQEDPVERKPFFHVVPGSRALSVSTAGCNLSCKFCEVWDMALVGPEDVHAFDLPPKALLAQARTAGVRSISFAFGEPVVFYEYMRDIARLARAEGLLNLIHTAGYILPEPLRELSELVDAANVDLKGFTPQFYRDVVGGELQPILESLKTLKAAGVHLEVTNVLLPTLNDEMRLIREMCTWIAAELGPDTPLHFARFYPLYRLTALPRTPISTLDAARATAREAGLNFVYVAKATGHEGENTFCPDCGRVVIGRVGFVIDRFDLDQGRCGHCGREIPGLWT